MASAGIGRTTGQVNAADNTVDAICVTPCSLDETKGPGADADRLRAGLLKEDILDLGEWWEAPTTVEGWCRVLKARSMAARRGVVTRRSRRSEFRDMLISIARN